MAVTKHNVKGDPSKTFFINMLTRDIDIANCIFDLIDNSIDSIIVNMKNDIEGFLTNDNKPLLGKYIRISINKTFFSIEDNCFGINVDTAKNYAFQFGTVDAEEDDTQNDRDKTGLSVYGIGMKRAFFKIGKRIKLISKTNDTEIAMDIDVDSWKIKKEWDFSLEEDQNSTGKTGTSISITNLNKSISQVFSEDTFINRICNKVERTYLYFINAGLEIIINDQKSIAKLPSFKYSTEIYPTTISESYSINENKVSVNIVAGLVDDENSYNSAGWYVFCNGRLVLEANKDYRTGWGNDLPNFHAKYISFIGYVSFTSDSVISLPWTTTKENIEFDSLVYTKALGLIKSTTRPYISFINKFYEPDTKKENVYEKELFDKSDSKPIGFVKTVPERQFKYNPPPPPKEEKPPEVRIQYSINEQKFKKVKKVLKSKSRKDVGIKTFNYFYEMECSDE